MSVRFQADADHDQTIVTALLRREPGIDFYTASAAGLTARDDMEVLAIAARDGRILVSHDGRTMPHHFAILSTQTSAGLLIVPQYLTLAAVVQDLRLIWSASSPEEWVNRICYLPLQSLRESWSL
jgi:Domain of unknown function (DUF5615)